MGGTLDLLKQPTPANKLSFNAHTPAMGGLHPSVSGGAYSSMPKQTGNPLYQNMDPPQMSQVPQYLSRYVAGPARLESNPLGEPLRTLRTLSPSASQSGRPSLPLMQDYDLKNPDV
jgi:hypothetical protein